MYVVVWKCSSEVYRSSNVFKCRYFEFLMHNCCHNNKILNNFFFEFFVCLIDVANMNEGESAGERPNIGFTPAVVNRRLIPNSSASLIPVRYFCSVSYFKKIRINFTYWKIWHFVNWCAAVIMMVPNNLNVNFYKKNCWIFWMICDCFFSFSRSCFVCHF